MAKTQINFSAAYFEEYFSKYLKKWDVLPEGYIAELQPHLESLVKDKDKYNLKIHPENEIEGLTRLAFLFVFMEMLNDKYGINLDE